MGRTRPLLSQPPPRRGDGRRALLRPTNHQDSLSCTWTPLALELRALQTVSGNFGSAHPKREEQGQMPEARGACKRAVPCSWPPERPIGAGRSHPAPAPLLARVTLPPSFPSPTQKGGQSKTWRARGLASIILERWSQRGTGQRPGGPQDPAAEPAMTGTVQQVARPPGLGRD